MATENTKADPCREALEHIARTIEKQLELIGERAPSGWLDKAAVMRTMNSHLRQARAALAASPQDAPVADHVADASKLVAPLRYVHLKRGTNGMCVVSLNGYEVIRDNGDVIDHMASPSWLGSYAAPQAAQTKAVADHIVGVNKLVGRPCTCHPSDNPPKPCSKHYALSECKAAHDRADAAPLTNTDVVEAWRTTDAARDDYGWTSCEWFQAGVRFAQRHYGIAATKESQP